VDGTHAVVVVADRTTAFELPRDARPAARLLGLATRAFRSLRSVSYDERLSSGAGAPLETRWRLEAPDRASYRIAGGPEAVLVGASRWDRDAPRKAWRRSDVTPLDEPAPIWGTEATNVERLRVGARTLVLAWVNPGIPAFFVARFDRRTMLPQTLEMTAAAHFMHHDYLAYNRPLRIRPPVP
jgi:hypothetical protein